MRNLKRILAYQSARDEQVKVELLAREFAHVLDDWLTPEQMRTVVGHAALGTKTCASHDFCDANMAMLEAYLTLEECDELEEVPDLTDVTDLFNAAWSYAKRHLFFYYETH